MAGDAEGAVKPPDAKCMYHCRMLLALIATIVLIIGIAMQVRFHLPPAAQPPLPLSAQWGAASTAETRACCPPIPRRLALSPPRGGRRAAGAPHVPVLRGPRWLQHQACTE
jgi:hypothetical protein